MFGVRTWQDKLCESLGCASVEDKVGGFKALIGQLERADFLLTVVDSGPVTLMLMIAEGEDSRAKRDRLLADEDVLEFFSRHDIEPERLTCSTESIRMIAPEKWMKKAPPVEELCKLLHLLAEKGDASECHWDRVCWTCVKNQAELGYEDSRLERLCSECREYLLAAQQEEPEQAAPTDDEDSLALMLDPYISPSRMLSQSEKLRAEYDKSPKAYWHKLLGWVALGQAALAGGLVLTLGVLLGTVAGVLWLVATGKAVAVWLLLKVLLTKGIKLVVVLLALTVGLGGSILSWFRRPSHDRLSGAVLERSDAPEFFSWMDSLSLKLEAPKVDLIVVDGAVNASASEKRLKKGGYCKVVTVGVPVLEICNHDELTSIMAHELSHLCHDDPKSRFIYRTMQSWNRVAYSSVGEGGFASFSRFANWFIPRFLVRAQVLVRAAERRADQAARRLVSSQIQASELVKLSVVGRLYTTVVQKELTTAVGESTTEVDLVKRTLDKIRVLPDERTQRAYREALKEKPHWLGTHPVLKEQFDILGLEPPENAEMDLSPAMPASTLVDNYPEVRKIALEGLRRAVETGLPQLRLSRRGQNRRLQLHQEHYDSKPTPSNLYALARAYSRVERDDEAIEALERLLAECPEHLDARNELVGLLNYCDLPERAAEVLDRHFQIAPERDEAELWLAYTTYEAAERSEKRAACARCLLCFEQPTDVLEMLQEAAESFSCR